MHKIDTGILTGCAEMHNFEQLFGLRLKCWALENGTLKTEGKGKKPL
jgi:hypothetical protein